MQKQAKLKLWRQRHLTCPESTHTWSSDVKHRKSQCYAFSALFPWFFLVVNTREFKWGLAMLSEVFCISFIFFYYAFKLYRVDINDVQLCIQYTKYINNMFNVTWTFRMRKNLGFLLIFLWGSRVTSRPRPLRFWFDHCALLTLGVSASSCLWRRLNGIKRQRAVVIRWPGDRFVREVGHQFKHVFLAHPER